MRKDKNFTVIISTVPFPYGNASDNAIYTFMDGFQEHGCSGEVVCLYSNSPTSHPEIDNSGEYRGVRYSYLCGHPRRSKSKFWNLFEYHILSRFKLKNYLSNKSKEFQVSAILIGHVNKMLCSISGICKRCGVHVVLCECEFPEFLAKVDSPKRRLQYIHYSRYIDKYIFETATLKDYERKVLGKDIDSIVVPATMPFEDIVSSERTTASSYIAYCGSIHSEAKDGLSNIIKAYSKFSVEYPFVSLKMIGRISNSTYYSSLLDLCKQLGVEENVEFTGEVTREGYVQYLKNATLLMVAKPRDSYYGGGLSSKVIEYLFSGNPVLMVASDDYVNYLSHKKNVYFVQDNAPGTLSDGMIELFRDNAIMAQIGRGGYDYALQHFNYHYLTKNILDFILPHE